MTPLPQAWPRPSRPRPIVIVGAGSIVQTAHLPAYRASGLPIAGLYDIRREAALKRLQRSTCPASTTRWPRRVRPADVVYDVAVPGDRTLDVLEQLPRGAVVLMQKPMGADLANAQRIRACVHDRGMIAAVNLQLRFSPGMLALRDLLRRNVLGTLVDIDVRVVIDQPWHLWPFLERVPQTGASLPFDPLSRRDPVRSRASRWAHTAARCGTRRCLRSRDTRSSIVLDYGDRIRCSLVLNHTHRAGPKYRASQLVVEGTAARLA